MELNLVGKTVTQAIALMRQALAACEDGVLVVSTDSETVKLNLYSHVHRLGLRCKAERKGPLHILQLRLDKKTSAALPNDSVPGSGPRSAPISPTAFPIAHLGGAATVEKPATPRPKRRSLIETESATTPAQERTAQQGIRAALARQSSANASALFARESAVTNRESAVAGRESALSMREKDAGIPARGLQSAAQNSVEPPAEMPIHPDATAWETVHPMPARPQWLVIQNDQIGTRDTSLGVDLLEELLNRLDNRRFAGIFLVHRGVRLLDPLYADGRLLRALLRHNMKLIACAQSVVFYQLQERISTSLAPFSDVVDLAAIYDLIWI